MGKPLTAGLAFLSLCVCGQSWRVIAERVFKWSAPSNGPRHIVPSPRDVNDCDVALMHRPMEIRVMPRALRCFVASLAHTTPGAGRRAREQTETSRFSRDVAQLAAVPLQPLMQRLHKTATRAVETACQRPSPPARSACASRAVALAVRRQSQRRTFCLPPVAPPCLPAALYPLLTPGRGDTNDTLIR